MVLGPRRQALLHPRRRLLLGPAGPLRRRPRTSTSSTRAAGTSRRTSSPTPSACNRDGTQFEILADRQRNNYETSLNAFGNVFTSDNDDDGNRGCRVIWVMDGGHYGYRTPGSPRHWGEEVPGNVPKLVGTGNGSPCGIMVYEGRPAARGVPRRRSSRPRPAPGRSTSSRSTRHGACVPDRVQGVPRQRRPLVPPGRRDRPRPTARSSSPTGTTPASAATASATRTPAGSTGSAKKGMKYETPKVESRND